MLIGQISYKVMSHDHDLTRFRVLGILIIFLMSYLHDLGYIYLHDILIDVKICIVLKLNYKPNSLNLFNMSVF